MSLLPTSALTNFGPTADPSATSLGGPVTQFGNSPERAGAFYDAMPQTISAQVSAAPSVSQPPAQVPPASSDVLKPQYEYLGNSLSVLKGSIDKVAPPAAAESLSNRLQLLDSQFRVIGDNLKLNSLDTDPIQLLKLQSDIYQMDEELELLTRVVDQATNGVRSLLQTQL